MNYIKIEIEMEIRSEIECNGKESMNEIKSELELHYY